MSTPFELPRLDGTLIFASHEAAGGFITHRSFRYTTLLLPQERIKVAANDAVISALQDLLGQSQ